MAHNYSIKYSYRVIILCLLIIFPYCAFSDSEIIDYSGNHYTIYSAKIEKDNIQLFWRLPDGTRFENADGLKDWLELSGKQLIFATNAGIFSPTYHPLGLHVENGSELSPINTKNNGEKGNFYLKPNGVFFISKDGAHIVETSLYKSNPEVRIASQSGPLLLINGQINSAFTKNSSNRVIRNGVGVKNGDTVVFAISNEEVNFYDFALFFRDRMGCKDALYLDGYISKMYIPSLDRLEMGGNFTGIFAIVD